MTFDVNSLSKSLQAARIGIPAKRYILLCGLMAVGASILWTIIWILGITTGLVNIITGISKTLIFILFSIIFPAGGFTFAYVYPSLTASGRKSKINLDLPYAITYMQALSTTIPLLDIFRSVYESDDLYGEVSKECGVIIRDVDVFGADLITAIENTRNTTPSDKFKELLNDLLMVYRSGGDLRNFFNAKSDSYRELAKNELESSMQFLEIIAEVYVTVFVAGPIAIMIMLVAQSLAGTAAIGNLMPVMYIGLPVGAIIIIMVLYLLLPQSTLTISKKEVRGSEFPLDIIRNPEQPLDKKFEKQFQQKKQINKISSILRHPVMFYISSYIPSVFFGAVFAAAVFFFWNQGILASLFPKSTPLTLVCLVIIAFMLPIAAAYEIRNRYVSGIEKQLPEFLREISDMRDIGMTLPSAIKLIAENKSGVLTSELKIVSKELNYGSSLSGALVRMENRVGLTNVKRSISLLVRASEVTDFIREILAIAVGDLEHYLKMKSKRFSASFAYVAIIYLSYGIFLFTAYVILGSFVGTFETMHVSFDIASSTQDMFIISIILAAFSGIMAGQMASNTPLAGLKHSMIMLIIAIVIFVFIL